MNYRRKFSGTPILVAFKSFIEWELDKLEDYINDTSDELNSRQKKISEDYSKALETIDENDDFDVEHYFGEEIFKYLHSYPKYTLNPLLLVLYGQFENWLKRICDFDSNKGLSRVTVSDFGTRNYIDNSRKYLSLVAEIDFDSEDENWKRITAIQKLRNSIVHNNSNVFEKKGKRIDEQPLYSFLIKESRINFDKSTGNFHIEDKSFLIDTIALMKNFLIDIIDKLSKRKVVAKNTKITTGDYHQGKDHSKAALELLISNLNLIDQLKIPGDNLEYINALNEINNNHQSLSHNLTKLFAFFSNGDWKESDVNTIIEKRESGLNELASLYH